MGRVRLFTILVITLLLVGGLAAEATVEDPSILELQSTDVIHQEEITNLKGQAAKAKDDNLSVKDRVDQLELDVANLTAQVTTLSGNLNATITSLQTQIDTLNTDVGIINMDIGIINASMATLSILTWTPLSLI